MTETTTDHADLLTQDAHLTELTVNRFLAGELDEEEVAAVEQHVVGCSPCNARLEAVRSFDAEFSLAPPVATSTRDEPPSNVVSLDEKRSSRSWIVAVLAAAAAIALVFVARSDQGAITPGPDDGIRLKGGTLTLEVFAKTEGAQPRRVARGDIVHPGDRLGFKVTSREPGFLMVVGIDDAGQAYGGWPQGAAPHAKFMEAQDGPRELEAAIQLDDVGGTETLVLVHCREAFDLATASKVLRTQQGLDAKRPQDPMSGCRYDEVPLKKQPRK